MTNKKRIIKNLLTTASVLTIATMAASDAMAGANRDINVDTVINVIGGWANGDTIKYTANDIALSVGADGIIVGSIDVDDKNPTKVFQVDGNVSVGNIVGALAGVALPVSISDAKGLTLTGNDYTKLGAVTLSGANALLIVPDGTDLASTINGGGKLNFVGASVMTGVIGGVTGLGEINVNGGAVVQLNANTTANVIKLHHVNSQLTLANGVTVTGAVDNRSGGANAVKLNFAGAGHVTGVIGATAELAEINVAGGVVQLDENTKAAIIKLNANNSEVTLGAGKTITGAVDNTAIGGVNAAKLNFAGAGHVTGVIGGTRELAEINVGAGAVQLDENTKAAIIKLNANNSEVTLGAGKTITGAVDNTSGAGANAVKLNFAGAGRVTGAIGATKALEEINVAAGAVQLGGATKVNTIKLNDNAGGSIVNIDGGVVITGAVDNTSGVDGKGKLNFAGAGHVTGVIGATAELAEINVAGGVVQLDENTKAAIIKLNANNSEVTLGAGKTITGAVDNRSGGANAVKLNFVGAGHVTGVIGATTELAEINVGAGAVQLDENTKAVVIKLTDVASEVVLGKNGDKNIILGTAIAPGYLVSDAAAKGVLTAKGGTQTITGAFAGSRIGSDAALDHPLAAINIEAGKLVIGANIDVVKATTTTLGKDATLELGNEATTWTGDIKAGADGQGKIAFNDAVNAVTIDGNIGETKKYVAEISAVDAGGFTLGNVAGTSVYAQDITIGKDGTAGNLVFGASLTDVTAAHGIKFQSTVGGDVLALTGNAVMTNIRSGDANNPTLIATKEGTAGIGVGAGKTTIFGNIGTKDKNFKTIAYGDVGTLRVEGDVYLSKVGLEHGIDFTNKAGTFVLADAKTIYGKIDASGANAGTLTFEGNGTVTGYAGPTTIGETNALTAINIGTPGGVANPEVRLNATTVKAQTISFAKDGTLFVGAYDPADANKAAVNKNIVLETGGVAGIAVALPADTGTGTVSAKIASGKTLTVTGKIGETTAGNPGTWTKALKELVLTDAGDLVLDTNGTMQHIKKITFANEASKVTLNQGQYVFHAEGKNPFIVGATGPVILGDEKNGVVIGASDKPADSITIKDNTTFASSADAQTQLYSTKAIEATGKLLTFTKGTHNINSEFGSEGGLVGSLVLNKAVAGDPTIVNLAKKAYIGAGGIILDEQTTVVVKDALVAGKLDGAGVGKGTLRFDNTASAKIADLASAVAFLGSSEAKKFTYDMPIGATKLAAIEVEQGGFAKLSNALVVTDKITFKHKDDNNKDVSWLVLSGANKDLAGITIETEGKGLSDFVYLENNGDVTIDTDIGASDKKIGGVVFGKDKTINVNTANVYGMLLQKDSGTGTVNVADRANATVIEGLGTADRLFRSVAFKNTKGVTVNDGMYAKAAEIDAGVAVTLGGSVQIIDGLKLNAAAGDATTRATFKDAAKITSGITTAANDAGAIVFEGSATIAANIGSSSHAAKSVEFTGDSSKQVALGGNIYGSTITMGAQQTTLTADSVLSGTTTVTNGNINVDKYTLTFAGGKSVMTGNTTLSFKSTDAKDGAIVVGSGAELDISSASGTLIFDDKAELSIAEVREVQLFKASDIKALKLPEKEKMQAKYGKYDYRNYEYIPGTGVVKITYAGAEAMAASAPKVNSETIAVLASNKNTGAAADFIIESAKMTQPVREDAAMRVTNGQSTSDSVQAVAAAVPVLSNVVSGSMDSITSRAMDVGPAVPVTMADAVSAGDEVSGNKLGAWFRPFYGQATQDSKSSNTSGYKVKNFGGTFGVDTMLNDNAMIGIALSGVKTDVKFKDLKAGDKTKVSTFLVSLYGMYKFADTNWFAQGVGNFGKSSIKSDEARTALTSKPTARDSFNPTIFGFEAMGGYTHKLSDTSMIVPMFGLAFNRIGGVDYKQTGAGIQNASIKQGAINKVEGILGLRAMTVADVECTSITPEVHAFVRQSLNNKNVKVTAQLDGGVDSFKTSTSKLTKTMFNVGFGVNAKSGIVEYGAGYDMHLADKYMGHQGTLKVRLSF